MTCGILSAGLPVEVLWLQDGQSIAIGLQCRGQLLSRH